MPTINILSDSNPDKSLDENSSSLINLYLSTEQGAGKYPLVAMPTPGATVFATINSPVRATWEHHGVLYAVGGNTFYSVNSSGVATSLGTLTTTTGFAKIRSINLELMIIDGAHGYIYNLSNSTFTTITDVNFTNTASDLNAQDEFFMVAEPNTQIWQISAISDGLTWTVLGVPQFASVSGNGNNLVSLMSLQRQIWLFSEDTTEVWYNAGQTGFTFARNTNAYIEWGIAAKLSVCYCNNTLYYLAKSRTGGPVVVMLNGYSPVKISNTGIDYQLSTYSTVSDAYAFCYQQEGHEFYCLTLPTAGVTWIYDVVSQSWHQRQSLVSGNQVQWFPQCTTFCYNKQLAGDSNTGNIVQLDMTNFTENTAAITRTLVTHPFYAEGQWIYVDKLQIDFDETANSSGNTFNLYVSKDGGRTFGAAKPASLAGAGTMISGNRVYWTRLGCAKNFVFKLTTTMNAKFIILGAWANIRTVSS